MHPPQLQRRVELHGWRRRETTPSSSILNSTRLLKKAISVADRRAERLERVARRGGFAAVLEDRLGQRRRAAVVQVGRVDPMPHRFLVRNVDLPVPGFVDLLGEAGAHVVALHVAEQLGDGALPAEFFASEPRGDHVAAPNPSTWLSG